MRFLNGGEHWVTAGQELLPRQVLRVPGPRAGDHPVLPDSVAVRGVRLEPEGFAGRDAGAGVCHWDHIVLGSARSHVDAATLRRALSAWTWIYSVRSSSKLDAGADFSQAFVYEVDMVWDFIYAEAAPSTTRCWSSATASAWP